MVRAASVWSIGLLVSYFIANVLISYATGRSSKLSDNYLTATCGLPTWIATLSFLAANAGGLEIIGLSAVSAQYGAQAFQFYWIGGIPGMAFLGLVVIPLFAKSGARSLPEFLEQRFGRTVRLLSAFISLISMAMISGITLYALSQSLHVFVGWGLLTGNLVCALTVLVYIMVGGIRATVYTAIFQLCVLIAGLFPLLVYITPAAVAGFSARPLAMHLWTSIPFIGPRSAFDCVGISLGLGFVISFSYWCTDFVQMQRALSTSTLDSSRKVPILAGFGKIALSFLIVLPSAAAPALLGVSHIRPDQTLPRLMEHFYGPEMLALGSVSIIASLMIGLGGSVSAFCAIWTNEIYAVRLRPNEGKAHYVVVSRIAVLACLLIGEFAANASSRFGSVMESTQLVVSLFYVPIFAVLLMGMIIESLNCSAAIYGISTGVGVGIFIQLCAWAHVFRFGSRLAANFYTSLGSFVATVVCCTIFLWAVPRARSSGLAPAATKCPTRLALTSPHMWALTGTLLALCLALNWVWR